jgi:hypothetical protein
MKFLALTLVAVALTGCAKEEVVKETQRDTEMAKEGAAMWSPEQKANYEKYANPEHEKRVNGKRSKDAD